MFNQIPIITMKKNQITLMALTFISGIVLGVSAIGLFSFTNAENPSAPAAVVTKINVTEANTLFKNYYQSTAPTTNIFKGFALTKEELTALNSLLTENSSLVGFRIYMGKSVTLSTVGIVVGVNSAGKDVTTSIYQSPAVGSGPCPTICDSSSPITTN
jgi:hypothetical protein